MPNTFLSVREQPFLPGAVRAEILKLMNMYHDGITFSAFAIAYHRKFNKYLPLVRGLDSLDSMISLIPELEIRIINNEKKICYSNNHINNNRQGISITEKNVSSSQQAKGKEYKVLHTINSTNIHKSGITEDVLQNFQLLLQKCPEGIVDVYFPPLYENLTKKNFDLLELGYNSIIELVDALPHVFKRILNPNGDKNWVIFPAKATVKHVSKAGNLMLPSSQMQTSPKIREGIPADAASPTLQYIQPTVPQNFDLNEYVPVFISAIINPSLFWFQLQTEDIIKEFEKFEKDMGYFYDNHANSKYTMNDVDVAIGATCIVCCPEDRQWYRAVIKAIPSIKFVNVLFVDYGSRANVPKANLCYVRSKYHDFPAHAFKAQLAGLKPPKNALSWNIKTQQRFIQLCECASLMAYFNPVDKDTFSAYLCDTSGDCDIHLNDTLINEGLAELCLENQFHVGNNYLSNDCKEPVFNTIRSESESYLSSESSEQNQLVSQSAHANSISESKVSPVKKLIFSPKGKVNGVEPNISHNIKRQDAKRYVKEVQLCKDYKTHVINLESKLYMTCGDLSALLWSEKDSSFLIERLKYKEVEIPFLELTKKDYSSLFEQCIWYKIPEYEKLKSSNSSLILYPLDCAFNVLNVFGHPSICLRLAIQNEAKSFDPFDPIWKEFDYDGLHALSDIEKEIEKQLNNLCLYDLKAKNEALKIKRIKLLRIENSSTTEEIKRIDNLQNVINRRMTQIETICSQYSSCS